MKAWHINNTVLGISPGPPRIDQIKSILIPRQELPEHIDPDGTQSDEYVMVILRPMADEYELYVILHTLAAFGGWSSSGHL